MESGMERSDRGTGYLDDHAWQMVEDNLSDLLVQHQAMMAHHAVSATASPFRTKAYLDALGHLVEGIGPLHVAGWSLGSGSMEKALAKRISVIVGRRIVAEMANYGFPALPDDAPRRSRQPEGEDPVLMRYCDDVHAIVLRQFTARPGWRDTLIHHAGNISI